MTDEVKALREIKLALTIIAGILTFLTPSIFLACIHISKIAAQYLKAGR